MNMCLFVICPVNVMYVWPILCRVGCKTLIQSQSHIVQVMIKASEPGTVYRNSVTQLPFAAVQAVRIISIHFCIYSVTEWVQLNIVLKIEVHRVFELELEQTSNDSKCSNEITLIMNLTNKIYICSKN